MTRFPAIPLRIALVALLASVAGAPAPALAQDPPDRVTLGLRLEGAAYGNFFQQAADSLAETVTAATLEGSVAARPFAGRELEAYAEGSYTAYEGLGPAVGATAGLRLPARPHAFDVAAGFIGGRPAFQVGDVLEQADIALVRGRYSYLAAGSWEVGADGYLMRYTFERNPGNDSDLAEVGGSLRYRGFGYRFSPEIGGAAGRRDADDPTEDYGQRDLFVRLISVPADGLWLSLRYRFRTRDYDTADPTASNFRREDDRNQWTLAGALELSPRLSLLLYYDFLDAESTRPDRTFTSQLLTLGVEVER